MKFATKYSVVPYQSGSGTSIPDPDEYRINQLDNEMTNILSRKIGIDEKMQLYSQILLKFGNVYHTNMPSVMEKMTKHVEKITKQIDELSEKIEKKEPADSVKLEPVKQEVVKQEVVKQEDGKQEPLEPWGAFKPLYPGDYVLNDNETKNRVLNNTIKKSRPVLSRKAKNALNAVMTEPTVKTETKKRSEKEPTTEIVNLKEIAKLEKDEVSKKEFSYYPFNKFF
jgi:hypothetical protein